MLTIEQATSLAKNKAKESGSEVEYITYDRLFGFVFRFFHKQDYGETPEPTGLPLLYGIKEGTFSNISDPKLIFGLLDLKGS